MSAADKKLSEEKKSVEWSKIFGLDRKKKSMNMILHPLDGADKRRKRCGSGDDCDEEDYGKFPTDGCYSSIVH